MRVDTHVCPICGQPNGCRHDSAAAGGPECWCSTIKVSPRVIARVPLELRGRACVCRQCIEKYA